MFSTSVRGEGGEGKVPKHIWDDKETNVAASNVDLFEVGDAAVAGGDGDVFELDVHVVFCFDQLAAVGLARGYFEGYDMALLG